VPSPCREVGDSAADNDFFWVESFVFCVCLEAVEQAENVFGSVERIACRSCSWFVAEVFVEFFEREGFLHVDDIFE